MTGSTVTARIGLTFVDISLTHLSGVSNETITLKSIHHFIAGSTILAWIRYTFLIFRLTIDSTVPTAANTSESVNIIDTRTTVTTRIGSALINIGLTVYTGESNDTLTSV